jgi:hypothetical protein
MLQLRCLFWISEIVVVLLVIIPIARFLLYQWSLRELEFVNRFSQGSLDVYLARFYARTEATKELSDIQLFGWSYRRLVGRHLYYTPTAMLMVIVALLGGLVIMTAIRAGYENYVDFYAKNAAVVTSLSHLSLGDLDKVVFPFPDIVLSAQALAAISGAYLYVVGVVIQGFRNKTLTSSDILWCSFRMVIAVPMAVSLSGLANSSLGPFIAFALGAFPIEALSRLLRRLMTKTLGEADEQNSDQLVHLAGASPQISAVLAGEGIGAIQQLASIDPVALSVRTGLPFDFILDLVAQAQAWRYLGPATEALGKLGLGSAMSIRRLVDRLARKPPDEEAKAVLTASAKLLQLDETVVKTMFNELAADPYTGFLVGVAAAPGRSSCASSTLAVDTDAGVAEPTVLRMSSGHNLREA